MYINNDIDYIKFLKNKKIYIWGCGQKGLQTLANLEKRNFDVLAFCDNDCDKQKCTINGLEVISFDDLRNRNSKDSFIIICSQFEAEIKYQLLNNSIYNFISVTQIDFGGGEEYYDEEYFKWQKRMGEFGGKIKAAIFKPHITENMVVVEFGAGGGYLLQNLTCKEKIGIEINDTARENAKKMGIKSVKMIEEIEDETADIIISTSVLEHVENPLEVLRKLRKKLKEGGKIVFHVPSESPEVEYRKSDINNHLYTWNCLNIGNLFKAAGYFVYSVERVQEVWPKHYMELEQNIDPYLFENICEIGGKINNENRCIIVAYK